MLKDCLWIFVDCAHRLKIFLIGPSPEGSWSISIRKNTMKNPLSLLLVIFLLVFASPSCDDDPSTGSGQANNDDDSTDDDENDDDATDDDAIDDDTSDDDTSDDDTIDDGVSPRIGNAYWEPNPTELREIENVGYYWMSYIYFSVCDPNNDLVPDGEVCLLDMPTIIAPCLDWRDLETDGDVYDVDDCDNPTTFWIAYTFATIDDPFANPPGEYCARLIVSDSAGHEDILEDLCVTHDPPVSMY